MFLRLSAWEQARYHYLALVQALPVQVHFVPVEVVEVILELVAHRVEEVIREGEERQVQPFQKEGKVMLFLKEMLQSWVLILPMHLNTQNKLDCTMDYLRMDLQNILG